MYGLTISNDGRYEVGPGPSNEVASGYLERSELDAFLKLLGKLHTADFALEARAPEQCIQAASGPVISVDLGYHESSHGLIRISGADVCYDKAFLASVDDAKSLQSWFDGLTRKYYPDIFPNACVTAAAELEKNFDYLKQCQQDSDCSYLDLNYLPVDQPNVPVLVDDCSFIEALPVANSFAAVANQRELLLQRELARDVCGVQLNKPSCAHVLGFDSSSPTPVCVEGACQINPKIKFH